MPATHRKRLINPRLGTYFGIFISALLSLLLICLMAEQLGAPVEALQWTMLAVPLAAYAAIGLAAQTHEPAEFFAAGRRVPAFFTGLGVAACALGGVGVVSLTGLMMMNGIDAWCIVNGIIAGLVVSAVMVAPYMRKFGSYSLPGYLGRRFDSRIVRLIAAAVLCVPLLLLIIAELKIAIMVGGRLTGASALIVAGLVTACVIVTLLPGGLRSMSWALTAAALTTLLALVIPAGIVATEVTNFPLAQFSYGPTLRAVGRFEDVRAIAAPILSPLAFDLAGSGLEPLTRRMSRPFGSLGPGSYVLMSLTLMMGIAVAPWLMPRFGATPGIYEARKSFGWAVFVFGALTLTASAIAVFERDIIMQRLVGQTATSLPDWFQVMVQRGDAAIDGQQQQLPMTAFAFKRDALLFMLPPAMHLPAVVLHLVLAGGLAAAFCGICSAVLALGSLVSEDVIHGSNWEAPAPRRRLLAARLAISLTAVGGAAMAVALPADPLQLVLWALGLSGAAAFPVVILSIWWKRITTLGAIAGIIAGFTVAVLAIAAGETSWFGIPSEIASILAVPAGFLAAFIGTRVGAAPGRNVLELVRDMRVPGGETVHDREQRLLRLKRHQRPT